MRWRIIIAIGALCAFSPAADTDTALNNGFMGRFLWQGPDPKLGGISAIDLDESGGFFVAVSDRGGWTQGRIARDDQGSITGLHAAHISPLNNGKGTPLASWDADSEGVALGPDGDIYVSLEGKARILRYHALDKAAASLPRPPDFDRFNRNGSLEAVAIAKDNTLYTLPERPKIRAIPFPLYRFKNNIWDQPFTIARIGSYLPVGADMGPDGRLYILERRFQGVKGFSNRVRRFKIDEGHIDQGETVLTTPTGHYGNMEGISVWRDAQNRLRLTMVSDDNFLSLLKTELIEYQIRD